MSRPLRRAAVAVTALFVPAGFAVSGTALAATVSSFSPTSGLTQTGQQCPGATVTISGSGFVSDGGPLGISFNSVPSPLVEVGSNQVVYAVVPDLATSGPISVTTAVGVTTSSGSFTVNPCPYSSPGAVSTYAAATAPEAVISAFVPKSARAGAAVAI